MGSLCSHIKPPLKKIKTEGNTTYLEDLHTRQKIGEIHGTDYFEGQYHSDFTVEWAPDSKWCVVTDWGRFGFGSSSILELKDASFTQTDIAERIQKSLDSVLQSNQIAWLKTRDAAHSAAEKSKLTESKPYRACFGKLIRLNLRPLFFQLAAFPF